MELSKATRSCANDFRPTLQNRQLRRRAPAGRPAPSKLPRRMRFTIRLPSYLLEHVRQSAQEAFGRVYASSELLLDSDESLLVQAACVVLACKARMGKDEYDPLVIFRYCARSNRLTGKHLLDAELHCLEKMGYHMAMDLQASAEAEPGACSPRPRRQEPDGRQQEPQAIAAARLPTKLKLRQKVPG